MSKPQCKNLVGLSLSFCVYDILNGKAKEGDVARILTSGSPVFLQESFDELLEIYARLYWQEKPEEGKAIARRFHDAGLLAIHYQNIAEGHWWLNGIVVSPDDIVEHRRKFLEKTLHEINHGLPEAIATRTIRFKPKTPRI